VLYQRVDVREGLAAVLAVAWAKAPEIGWAGFLRFCNFRLRLFLHLSPSGPFVNLLHVISDGIQGLETSRAFLTKIHPRRSIVARLAVELKNKFSPVGFQVNELPVGGV
jgi:hypothetical protein